MAYLQLEVALRGSLFDYIASQPLDESIARYYFSQLVNVLQYCHSRGLVHRDIKPDNILLDDNFDIKLIDFGFTGPIEGRS